MKALNTILKIVAALAAVAGAIYVVATYGDKIVAWAKKLWSSLPQCPEVTVTAEPDAQEPQSVEEASQEVAVEAVEEAPAVEIPENEPVADEADFAE